MTKKTNHKALQRMKRRRRRTLTLWRMCRYGVHNFSRNAWLTVAATAVMSVTLLIIFVTVSARQVLSMTVDNLSETVDYSIYLKGSSQRDEINQLSQRLTERPNVKAVHYVSPDEARQNYIEQNKRDSGVLEAIKEAANRFPATLRVNLHDVNNTTPLEEFIKNDELYQRLRDPAREPSFAGKRRESIKKITEWIDTASIVGAVTTVVFIIISALVVFNTIRMAIFNRKDEIQMMKLIGAERGFIRGPFIIESMMYGFIAALIATGAGYGLLFAAREPMTKAGLPMQAMIDNLVLYVGLVVLAMVVLGALIGALSSFVATRKYLKI